MQKKRLFNFRAVLACALSTCFGIASVKNLLVGSVFLTVFFACLFLLVLCTVFIKQFKFSKKEKVVIVCCLIFFFSLGGLVFNNSYQNFCSQPFSGYYLDVSAKVVDAKQNESGQSLTLSKVVFNGKTKSNYKIRLYVYGDNEFDVGDLIEFNALIKQTPIVYQNKFSADNVVNKTLYIANVSCDEINLTGKNLTIFEHVNLFMRNTLRAGLDKTEFSIAYALLTGNSNFMDSETLSAYRMAGVAHVFAVSGLHIGFLAMALSFLFKKFKINNTIKVIVLPLILFAYSGVCSFTSSSLRASIMTTGALLLTLKGLRYDRLTVISIAGLLILIFAPANLFEVGFQLSFSVVLGIALFASTFERLLLCVKRMPKKLASGLSVALSAQMASVPVMLFHFKSVSLIAVFFNVVFIPAVSVIFTGLFLLTIIGGVFNVPKIALFIPNYVLKLVNFCITAIDYKIFILNGAITVILAFSFYWALLFISEYFNIKLLNRIICSLVCVIFTISGCLIYTANEKCFKFYVVGGDKLCATLIDTTKEKVLVVSYAKRTYSLARLIRLKNENDIDVIDQVIFLNDFGYYEQEFLTKMRLAFDFNGVCCYGEQDETLRRIIEKSFGKDKKVGFYLDNHILPIEGATCTYLIDGRALDIEVDDGNACIFSSVDGENYSLLDKNYTIMIAKDRVEQLFSFYQPTKFISYCDSEEFLSADTLGTQVIKLEK